MNYDQPYKTLIREGEIYASLFDYPNECPYCHKIIIPEYISEYFNKPNHVRYVTLLCSNNYCNKPFIASYIGEDYIVFHYDEIINITLKQEIFSKEINSISPQFIQIYNEAFFAEQYKLFEICGVAYRKSLEFLIKDYLISENLDEKETIMKMSISNCISTFIDDSRLKSTASRAIWLGNDHTHYEKKWENKDLEDLKILIKLTINWVESGLLTKQYEEEMPK